jgi:phospholipase C
VDYRGRRGDIELKLRNEGERACVFTIRPLAYRNDGPWTVRVKAATISRRA